MIVQYTLKKICSFRALIVVLCAVIAAVPIFVFAQTQVTPIQYIVSPETPQPGEEVRIDLQGVGSFLGNSLITWSIDGKTVEQGVGDSSYVFTAGEVGVQKTVTVSVKTNSYGTLNKTITITPSTINLIWEADTTTPPFYRGRALYSGGSKVTVTAFPTITHNKTPIPQKALSYQWTLNDEPLQMVSGIGKNTLVFQGDQLKKYEEVGLDVYHGSTKVGHKTLSIEAISPRIIFYQRNPLRGEMFNEAMTLQAPFTGNEMTLQAEPFFFANSSIKTKKLLYTWTIDGTETSGPDTQRGIITLRRNGDGGGSAVVDVTAQNTANDQLVQSTTAFLRIMFNNKPIF